MIRIAPASLLLSVALFLGGCKSAPQPQPAQTSSNNGDRRSGADEDYNRGYGTEEHHRHHHGRRGGEAPNDNWSNYDRPAGDGTAATQRDQRAGGDGAQSDGAHGARSRGHHNSRAMTAAPGQFDFYVLNLSWSPEFCHGHPSAAECAQHRAFTLHGLWPQNDDGTYPEDCGNAPGPSNPSQYADIYPDASLLQHEWQTHGTCSGLGADAFLSLARRADQSIHIPPALQNLAQQSSMSPAQIVTALTQSNPGLPASSIAISCGNNFLTAVEVCMDKNLKPEACQAVKTCGANQIRIPAPQ